MFRGDLSVLGVKLELGGASMVEIAEKYVFLHNRQKIHGRA